MTTGSGSGVSGRNDRVALAVVGAAMLLFAGLAFYLRSFVTDDAFISLRYARNLARGYGPVFNSGGLPVEGYSNPIYVFGAALVYRLGGDGVAFVRLVGVASGLALIPCCWALGRAVVGPVAATFAAMVVAASPALAYWAVGGLETLPMALVLTVAALILARPDGGSAVVAGLLLALLPWIRPEGLGVALALVFFSEVRATLDGARRREAVRRLAWLAGVPILSQLALQTLRWVWYAHLLPNPVVYKAGTGSVGRVTATFLIEAAPVVLLAAVGFFRVAPRARLLAVPVAVYGLASITFKDSVNTFSRLVLPVYPLLVLLAAAGLVAALGRIGWRPPAVAAAATTAVALLMLLVMPANIGAARSTAESYRECRTSARTDGGEWLRERLEPGDAYAIGDAGVLPYYADGRALDIFGLNDPLLQTVGTTSAAVRADRALDLRPRFLVLASSKRDRLRPLYQVEHRLRADDRFDLYEKQVVTGAPHSRCDYYLHLFERRDP